MKKLEAIFFIAIFLISFAAQAIEPPFREHDINSINYKEIMSKGKIQLYAEPKFQELAKQWADKVVNIYDVVRECYPKFMKEKLTINVNINDENNIYIMLTKVKRMNGANKIVPSDYNGPRKVEAITRCTPRDSNNLYLDRRTSVFISGEKIKPIMIKHEFFHVLVCRTLNWEPNLEIEERFARIFESYKCE